MPEIVVREEALRVFGNPLQDLAQLGSDLLLAFDGISNPPSRKWPWVIFSSSRI
jgi:hypothetical protein